VEGQENHIQEGINIKNTKNSKGRKDKKEILQVVLKNGGSFSFRVHPIFFQGPSDGL
jgi:hypothetical protein